VTNAPENFLNQWKNSNMQKRFRNENEKKYATTPLPFLNLGGPI